MLLLKIEQPIYVKVFCHQQSNKIRSHWRTQWHFRSKLAENKDWKRTLPLRHQWKKSNKSQQNCNKLSEFCKHKMHRRVYQLRQYKGVLLWCKRCYLVRCKWWQGPGGVSKWWQGPEGVGSVAHPLCQHDIRGGYTAATSKMQRNTNTCTNEHKYKESILVK